MKRDMIVQVQRLAYASGVVLLVRGNVGEEGRVAMLRTQNKYCSNCLSTQRFLDLGSCLICERCSKRLEQEAASDGNTASATDGTVQPAWLKRPKKEPA